MGLTSAGFETFYCCDCGKKKSSNVGNPFNTCADGRVRCNDCADEYLTHLDDGGFEDDNDLPEYPIDDEEEEK